MNRTQRNNKSEIKNNHLMLDSYANQEVKEYLYGIPDVGSSKLTSYNSRLSHTFNNTQKT